ncbi:Mannanase [Aphelenchoides besseyi]|nr:Mannanase [Aphelenchoides besseyi]
MIVSYQCSFLQNGDYNFVVLIPELNITVRIDTELECSNNKHKTLEYEFAVTAQPELWYPNGYGEAKLYDLTLIVNYKNLKGWTKKSITTRIGFKNVTLNTNYVDRKKPSFGRNFFFVVNSIPIFLKGANYIPVSVFPSDFSLSTLRFYFHSIVNANMNTIRIWGGGEWPSDEFFELANQNGILVFHDLMFACALYPTNPEFLHNVNQEIEEQILRIRRHPSLLIYSGNNELELGIRGKWWFGFNYSTSTMISDYTKLMSNVLETTKRVDPTTPIIRSSPSNALVNSTVDALPNSPLYGDVHFYNELINLWKINKFPIPRCATEFGVPSFPLRSTMIRYIPETEWSYGSRLMNSRNHHPLGVATLLLMTSEHFEIPRRKNVIDMDNFAYITQLHQAIALRTETEHYRRYRSSLTADGFGNTMCALYWQLNDVWAAPTWSSIDFDHRWKAAHYHARHMFSPVLISLYTDETHTTQIFIVSDRTRIIRGASVRLRMMTLGQKFDPIFSQNITLDIAPLKSTKVNYSDIRRSNAETFFLTADLYDSKGRLISNSLLPFEKLYDTKRFGTATLQSLKHVKPNVFKIAIIATDVVPFVWLDLNMTRILKREKNVKDFHYYFSDNAFYITRSMVEIELYTFDVMNITIELEDIKLCWIYEC